MVETLRWSPIYLEDLAIGVHRNTVRLQNNQELLLQQINLGAFIEPALLDTLRPAGVPGTIARITDETGGYRLDTGVQWVHLGTRRHINAAEPPFNVKADGLQASAAANVVGLQRAIDLALEAQYDLYIPGGPGAIRLAGHLYWGHQTAHQTLDNVSERRNGHITVRGDGDMSILTGSAVTATQSPASGTFLWFEDGYQFKVSAESTATNIFHNVRWEHLTIAANTPADYVVDVDAFQEMDWYKVHIIQRATDGHGMRLHPSVNSINVFHAEKCNVSQQTEDLTGVTGCIGVRIAPRTTSPNASSGSNIVFDRCWSRNWAQHFDIGSAASPTPEVPDIHLYEVLCQNGYNGIIVRNGVDRTIIRDGHFERMNGETVIAVTGAVSNVEIRGNLCGSGSLAAGAAAIELSAAAFNIIVENNSINNLVPGQCGIRFTGTNTGQGFRLAHNTVRPDTGGDGIDFGTVEPKGVVLDTNTLTGLDNQLLGTNTAIYRTRGGTLELNRLTKFARGTSIASASTITLPTDGNYVLLTGTTDINRIDGQDADALAITPGTFILLGVAPGEGPITFKHNTDNLFFRTAADLTLVVNEVVMFVWTGTKWACVGSDT